MHATASSIVLELAQRSVLDVGECVEVVRATGDALGVLEVWGTQTQTRRPSP
eukprot:TRINITY_DN2954_c0_g1_i1.p3 TRINITY_DN2954_c0_g1~~TRINITY_DN2954_c0_g1_i1.p3  ORF type:complete len:52 (-),score=2.65 TRINITY_DN2954_c0_g1_i1:176-331(-)